jgi:hypothetical protein
VKLVVELVCCGGVESSSENGGGGPRVEAEVVIYIYLLVWQN